MIKRISKSEKPAKDADTKALKKKAIIKRDKKALTEILDSAKLSLAEQNTRIELLSDLQLSILSHVKQLQREAEAGRAVVKADTEVVERKLIEINRLASETVAEIRRAIGVIDPNAKDSDLDLSVQELLDMYRGLGLNIKFATQGSQAQTSSGMSLSLFKMLKEALENSLQFGGPGTNVDAVVTWGERGASLTMTDDGIRAGMRAKGMDETSINEATKYDAQTDAESLINEKTTEGIKLLKKRVELYGGTLILQEAPGLGLNLSISIPDLMNGLVLLDH
ncbi:MAG: hypothetical protein KF916_00350 [Microbacteriaceae bacterium]|nr:hypothetical protein [Microbacteriaceae bacterium]